MKIFQSRSDVRQSDMDKGVFCVSDDASFWYVQASTGQEAVTAVSARPDFAGFEGEATADVVLSITKYAQA